MLTPTSYRDLYETLCSVNQGTPVPQDF